MFTNYLPSKRFWNKLLIEDLLRKQKMNKAYNITSTALEKGGVQLKRSETYRRTFGLAVWERFMGELMRRRISKYLLKIISSYLDDRGCYVHFSVYVPLLMFPLNT